jgi:hypothetical protein
MDTAVRAVYAPGRRLHARRRHRREEPLWREVRRCASHETLPGRARRADQDAADEKFPLNHTKPGLLSLANARKNMNGSQVRAMPSLHPPSLLPMHPLAHVVSLRSSRVIRLCRGRFIKPCRRMSMRSPRALRTRSPRSTAPPPRICPPPPFYRLLSHIASPAR